MYFLGDQTQSMKFNKETLGQLDRKYKLNLVNSLSGVKSANLIGTKSLKGQNNVAIFSSVVHISSKPPLLGMITRPETDPPKDTYQNIKDTEYYTINHVSQSFIEKAHYTSAKLPQGESEFLRMNIEEEFIDDFHAPFVKESGVKIGLKHYESVPLPNGCMFVIGSIELVVIPDAAINELGQLDLAEYDCAGISGLNTYYGLTKKASFPYVRNNEIPSFE